MAFSRSCVWTPDCVMVNELQESRPVTRRHPAEVPARIPDRLSPPNLKMVVRQPRAWAGKTVFFVYRRARRGGVEATGWSLRPRDDERRAAAPWWQRRHGRLAG